MKKCVELKKKSVEIDKKFKKFVDGCRNPDEYDKRRVEFNKIKTKIGLGENEMKKNCVKENCPSEFCSKLYDEIINEISKKE